MHISRTKEETVFTRIAVALVITIALRFAVFITVIIVSLAEIIIRDARDAHAKVARKCTPRDKTRDTFARALIR